MTITGRDTEARNGDKALAERGRAVDAAILAIEKQFGRGSIMKLGSAERQQVDSIPTGSIALDLALGVGGLVDGANLTRLLKGMKDNNPRLFADVFACKGNDFLRAAEAILDLGALTIEFAGTQAPP